jgi:hypothetical protein
MTYRIDKIDKRNLTELLPGKTVKSVELVATGPLLKELKITWTDGTFLFIDTDYSWIEECSMLDLDYVV